MEPGPPPGQPPPGQPPNYPPPGYQPYPPPGYQPYAAAVPGWATGPSPWQWGGPQLAGFGSRLVGTLVDGIILVVPMMVLAVVVVVMIAALTQGAGDGAAGGAAGLAATFLFMVMMALFWVIPIGYQAYFLSRTGQTPGRKVAGVKVLDMRTGLPPTMGKAALRAFIAAIASAQVFYLGYLWMLWDDQKRTWHDMVASTVVVNA